MIIIKLFFYSSIIAVRLVRPAVFGVIIFWQDHQRRNFLFLRVSYWVGLPALAG